MADKINKKKILPWIVIITALFIFSIGGLSARYITTRNNSKNIVKASNFYFESSLLKEESENASVNINGGTTSVSFDLCNFADGLRYADTDIYYEVTVNDVTATVSPSSGVLSKDSKQTAIITLSGITDNSSYIVTARGYTKSTENTEGFQKELKATFTVSSQTSAIYKAVRDHTDYIDLDVWTTGNYCGTVSIAYPSGLIPDNTNSAMTDWVTVTSGSATKQDSTNFVLKNSSYRYRFFKVNVSDSFTASQFNITLNGASAVTGE